MLTNLVEGYGFNSVKCSMYWPHLIGGFRRFNNIEVQLYDVQEAPDYIVRKLDVSNRNGGSTGANREIVHIQYTAWPDRSAPEEPHALIQLIRVTRVLASQYRNSMVPDSPVGPLLVHCSAGVGRTGDNCLFVYLCC